MRIVQRRWVWVVVAAALVAAGGGYVGYRVWLAPTADVAAQTSLRTAAVTRGDILITTSGSGVLVPAVEANLAFSTAGTLVDLRVDVGDRVPAGEVLARIDDAAARRAVAAAEVQVMQAEQTLALAQMQAELAVAQAEVNLANAQSALDALLEWQEDNEEVELARARFLSAQASYWNTLKKAGMRDDQLASTRINLDQAIAALSEAQTRYTQAMSPDRDWERNIQETRDAASAALHRAQQALEIAQAAYNLNSLDSSTIDVQNAKASMLSAQSALAALMTPPDAQEIAAAQAQVQQATLALTQARYALADHGDGLSVAQWQAHVALEQAQLALRSAREALAGTTLVAPFAGIVVSVNGTVGDTVNGTVIVLADLDAPVVQFWVEEADLQYVAVGNRVSLTFEALPDLVYTGEVYRVDPVLVNIANTAAVQAWATVATDAHAATLLGDMNVEVEIVAGEALNAVLVPIEALRQVGDQMVVFVVQPDGGLEMRVVEIGLQDYVNAEVKSGLEAGDVVTLGAASAASSTSVQSSTLNQQQMPMLPDGGFMPMGGGRP